MELQSFNIPPQIETVKERFGIVGSAPALIGALERAVTVAPIDLSVLITGESGTGKEFFPKVIHQFSPRKHSRYIAVNCGAIPEGTIDSELFGHEKGAFTGAIATRKGYFEEADGGTVFLDEVAELPLTTQARLLRVLESGEFMKVGSSAVQKTNIRIVAATNVDMRQAVAQGRFREDLYYRLSTVQIHIPPLRERGNDILQLAAYFSSAFAERYRTPRISFDNAARDAMLLYRWPGNVRQLKNVVEQLSLFEAGKEVGVSVLAPYMPDMVASYTPVHARGGAGGAYESEREMLFNLILRLQREIDTLRGEIEADRKSRGSDAQAVGFTSVHDVDVPEVLHPVTTSLVRMSETPAAVAPAVTATPTLEENEREVIKRALRRNMGRRREAAAELNISERTLYRKIKEYGLE